MDTTELHIEEAEQPEEAAAVDFGRDVLVVVACTSVMLFLLYLFGVFQILSEVPRLETMGLNAETGLPIEAELIYSATTLLTIVLRLIVGLIVVIGCSAVTAFFLRRKR